MLEDVSERVTSGEMTVECVYSQAGFTAMAGAPAVAEAFGALLDHEGATVYRYEGEIPHVLAVLDDCVWIRVDDRGHVRATLRVEDAVVRAWARETFERYLEAATVVEHPREVPALDHGTSVD